MSPIIRKLRKAGFIIEAIPAEPSKRRIPSGFCTPNPKVGAAVDEYLALKVRVRGDGKRIADKHGIGLSSLLTQLKRRTAKSSIPYPKIYNRGNK
jgi:hypothetical protein